MEIVIFAILAAVGAGGYFLLRQMFQLRETEQKLMWMKSQEHMTIRIDVPKNNDKAPLAAEQMFASLHGIYSETAKYQNHMSFEIVAKDKYIQFYVNMPKHLRDFVEGQIYAQYPTVEINDVEDYTTGRNSREDKFAGMELKMTKPDVYPIKLFSDFEVDPLSAITSVMTKLAPNDEIWLQVLIRPVGDEWQERGNSLIKGIRSGKSFSGGGLFGKLSKSLSGFLKLLFTQAVNPGAEIAEQKPVELAGPVEDALKQIEMKIMKLGYETKVRILSISEDTVSARSKCHNLAAAYKQYNTTHLNGFKMGEVFENDGEFWDDYVTRNFESTGSVFNIGELASIYHLPHETVATPNIVWSGSKKGEPPAGLPISENTPVEDLTIIGETTFRHVHRLFGVKRDDRRRHIYVIGKSGVGKSVLLENLAIDDLLKNRGVIVVDPHGEFAEKVLACVPDDRVDDVIVFDPADRAFPIAFNLLEHVDDDFKGMVASGFVGIFKKIFGNSWGPRLEHILRNTVLALLDFPDSTMLDIPRMLTEARFRDRVVEHVKDTVIREFWTMEFAQYDNKFRTEAVSPILNKVGQFLATATIRNIVGQPKSSLNIREVMDNEKIMIVNLSRGKIGEDNSALLGAMMITKIQLAAMSRADITVDQRPDSYLYVDEFQNFATESFAVILSEARKYHLNLTIANQYITQMPEEVRDAVFGNAGTIISFRVGGADADFLVKEFEPVFDNNDMVNLDKYNIYIKLLVDGISSPAFSARTLPPVDKISGNVEKIIDLSRKKYSKPRAVVEEAIQNRSLQEQQELVSEANAFKKGGLEAILTKKNTSSEALQDIQKIVKEDRKKEEEKRSDEKNFDNRINDNEKKETEEKNKQGRGSDDEKKEIGDSGSKKPRNIRHENIIGNTLYKEQTARGGIKWYIGEDIDLDKMAERGVVVTDEDKKMIDFAQRASVHINKLANKNEQKDPKRKSDESANKDTKVNDDKNSDNNATEGNRAGSADHREKQTVSRNYDQTGTRQSLFDNDDKDKKQGDAALSDKIVVMEEGMDQKID